MKFYLRSYLVPIEKVTTESIGSNGDSRRGEKIQNGCSGKPGDHETSGLAYIDFQGSNPFELFQEWLFEARAFHLINSDTFCLSTCNKEGKTSCRHLLIRRLDEDGIVIMTDGRSRKSKELEENPQAAMAFLWSYIKDGQTVNRQVRLEGRVDELPQSSCVEIWEREPLYCKIRANICHQGVPTDWQDHKDNHDRLFQDFLSRNVVPEMPSHVAFYKLIPNFMDFYHSSGNTIADRLVFNGVDEEGKIWKSERIMA